MDFGCQIPIVSGILDSFSCVPDSKAHDSGFHKPKLPRFRNQESNTWGDSLVNTELKIKGQKVKISCNLTWDISLLAICVTLFCDRQVKSKLKKIVSCPHSLHTFTCRAIISFFTDTFISIANVNTLSFVQARILETLAS